MSENILVVEYEPRYTDRVRQALAGQPFTPTFARDGEEAIRALDLEQPRLIVLSSVVPKVSTTELIRAIRGRKPLQETPILLTVSGYNGKSPKADAQRVGASDILPKPYSETEFLGKVHQILGSPAESIPPTPQLTSNEIFGDLVDEEKPLRKTQSKATGDVDKMLADTLGGMMPQRRKDSAPPAGPPSKTRTGELDKRFQDTLSGLEKAARRTTGSGSAPTLVARPVPTEGDQTVSVPPAAPRFDTEKVARQASDRIPLSQPVFDENEAARHEEEDPVDGTKFGHYVLIERIATGGMAEVWKARMRGVEGFQKIVAIKKILPHLSDNQDFIEMFVDEAKLAAQLNHNNITHIYDLGKIQSSYYIAMEYIDGFDLKTILRRGKDHDHPMTVELALFIASKIASALDYAHRKKDFEEKEMGLVHRDVSPQNVLISQEGDIKLCDFGIAKAASKASHTQAGALKGKLQYMSPEQAWGRNIDRRSDIFALATVLYEMLTGRKLFTGDNELSILEQVREARVQPPSLNNDEVTPEIDRIVLRALQKDPDQRYQTAGEMARDIDAILYSFRPTPTSADLAIYMHRLSAPEPVMTEPEPEPFAETPAPESVPTVITPIFTPPPQVIRTPSVTPAAAAPAAHALAPVSAAPAAAYAEVPEPARRKAPVGIIAAVVALLLVGAAVAFVMTRPAAPPAQQRPATNTVAAGTAAVPPAQLTTNAAPALASDTSGTLIDTATGATVDPSLVDAEVQKRIAAERARLEALSRAQQQSTAPAQPPRTTPAAAPSPQVAQTQTVAPAAQQETRPAAPSPQTETAAQQAAAQPPPAAAQPAPAQAPRTREGDLIPAGAEGLTPARLVRQGSVPYPPMARAQRVEGTVLMNVLVSESGAVMEVRLIRGINRPVGLNEAAEQKIRRSSFAPGTKDGVRVKSWVTVPVDFKL